MEECEKNTEKRTQSGDAGLKRLNKFSGTKKNANIAYINSH